MAKFDSKCSTCLRLAYVSHSLHFLPCAFLTRIVGLLPVIGSCFKCRHSCIPGASLDSQHILRAVLSDSLPFNIMYSTDHQPSTQALLLLVTRDYWLVGPSITLDQSPIFVHQWSWASPLYHIFVLKSPSYAFSLPCSSQRAPFLNYRGPKMLGPCLFWWSWR